MNSEVTRPPAPQKGASRVELDPAVLAEAPQQVSRWLLSEVVWYTRVLISSVDRFYWDNGFSRAASLAYTTLLSLVPLTALLFGILASFAVSSPHVNDVRSFIFRQFIPDTAGVDNVILYLSDYSEVMLRLNMLVILVLVATALLLVNSVEYVLNEIWQVFESRTIPQKLAIFCAILVIAPVLALSAYYFTKFRLEPLFADIQLHAYAYAVYQQLLPFLIDFGAFLLLYFLVPRAPVRFRSALLGAFIAALLFDIAKWGFALYIERFSAYDKIYGTVAVVPIFLFWLYLAWVIVLIGAEVSYQAQHLPRQGRLWKRSLMSVGDGGLVLALQALTMIARAFEKGRRMPSDIEIAAHLGCSTVVLKPALSSLERAGIIARSDSREMALTLLKSPDTIYLADIQNSLLGARGGLKFSRELEKFYGSFGSRELAQTATLGEVLDICRKSEEENGGT